MYVTLARMTLISAPLVPASSVQFKVCVTGLLNADVRHIRSHAGALYNRAYASHRDE